MLNLKKIRKFELIIFVLYMIISSVIIIKHEFTLDECQSWLLARDLDFLSLIHQMKYEGHYLLWYILIMPFAKLGLSIEFQKIIPILIMSFTAYIILYKSPFNKIEKTLLVFSGGALYYYLFSRPYCLIPLLLSLIAYLYKDRSKYPIIYPLLLALLSQTHLIIEPVVLLLSIEYFYNNLLKQRKTNSKTQNRKLIISFIMLTIMAIIVIATALVGYFNCAILNVHFSWDIFKFKLSKSMLATAKVLYSASKNVPIYFCILIIIYFILAIICLVKDFKNGIVFWFQFLFSFIIQMLFWFEIPGRVFLIIYTFMFWVWITYGKEERLKRYTLIFLLILTFFPTLKAIKIDYKEVITPGYSAANFIKKNIDKNAIFIYPFNYRQEMTAGYLPKDDYKIYSLIRNEYVTFSIWDNTYASIGTIYDEKKVYELLYDFDCEPRDLYYIHVYLDKKDDYYSYIRSVKKELDMELIYDQTRSVPKLFYTKDEFNHISIYKFSFSKEKMKKVNENYFKRFT